MLKLNISYLTSLRSIKRTFTYLLDLGLSRSVAQRVSSGEAKVVNLAHLTKLCLALRCTPNDLLEWQGDPNAMDQHHPLRALINDKGRLENVSKIKNMSLEKLERLNDLIGDME
ncbi:MAG: helix-turn-helix transcriptional regulator [Reichenbachiella sp.]